MRLNATQPQLQPTARALAFSVGSMLYPVVISELVTAAAEQNVKQHKEKDLMKSRLIVVEGIPGSGKTTTAKYIRDWVAKKGLKPMMYLEDAAYHPVDIDNLAFFDDEQYKDFIEEFSDYQHVLEKISDKSNHGYCVHYRRWGEIINQKMPAEISGELYAYDAHDTLPPEKYRELLKERWQKFGEQAQNSNEVIIFECCLLQNPLTVFVGKHNYEIAEVKSLINELADHVLNLKPVMIHLRGKSAREIIQRVVNERPQAWIEFVEEYITCQGYGRANQLNGREGIYHFYEMMQEIEEEIILQLDWRKQTVDISNWNWEQQNQEIIDILEQSI